MPIEKQDAQGAVGKVCTLIAGTSSITVDLSQTHTLPLYLMGSANGIVAFDECDPSSLGVYNEVTIVRRDPASATLKLWLHQGSELYQEFISENESPRSNASLSLVLYAKDSCNDAPGSFKTIQKPLTWQIHYPNGEDCDGAVLDGR